MRSIQRGNYFFFLVLFFLFFILTKPSNITGKGQNLFLPSEALSSAAGGAMLSLNQHLVLIPRDITLKVELQG